MAEQIGDDARVAPGLQVARVSAEIGLDRLQPLAIDAGQVEEVVGQDRAVAELAHPVALELVEPVEPEVGIDEPAMDAETHEEPERVEAREAAQPAAHAEA